MVRARSKRLNMARADFAKLFFGSLEGHEKEVWKDRKSLRKEWDKKLDKLIDNRKSPGKTKLAKRNIKNNH